MGVVYRVEHIFMRKRFALKVLDCMWAKTPGAFARFEREAIAAGTVADPHVAQATDFGRLADGSCFLVLEYIDGQTLRSALRRGALKPRRALTIVRGIVSAIEAAHAAGIVHRDLKPENVMLLKRDDDPDYVKVLDFGIAAFDPSRTSRPSGEMLTLKGAIMGTPSYMAPEQVRGERADARADLYAIGVIFFEMLTGDVPFHGATVSVLLQQMLQEAPPLPPPVLAEVGEHVAQILRRLLAKDPDARFTTARELRGALEQRLSGAGSAAEAPAESTAERQAGTSAPAESTARRQVGASPIRARMNTFLDELQARRTRRRASVAMAWPRIIGDRFRAWRRRRRLNATLATVAALPKRLQKWTEQKRTRVTRRDLAFAFAVVTALLLAAIAWRSGRADGAPVSSAPASSEQSLSSGSTRSMDAPLAPHGSGATPPSVRRSAGGSTPAR
jgi:hypothetical protein